jgi:hypothetical protein
VILLQNGHVLGTVGVALAMAVPPLAFHSGDLVDSLPVTDRHIYPATHVPEEWPEVGPPVSPVADTAVYVRGGTPVLRVKLVNPAVFYREATVTLTEAKYTTPSGVVNLGTGSDGPEIVPPNGGIATFEFNLTGLPNTVSYGLLTLKLSWTALPSGGGEQGLLCFFVQTEATPVGGSLGWMNPVWTEVARDAGTMAHGVSGSEAVRQALTQRYFLGMYLIYDEQSVFVDLCPGGPVTSQPLLNLSQYYDNRSNNVDNYGNCEDFAAMMHVLSAAMGLPMEMVRVKAAVPSPNNDPDIGIFHSNEYTISLGHTRDDAYFRNTLYFHVVNRAGGSCYDACYALARDLSGAVYKFCVPGWNFTGWWQTYGVNSTIHLPGPDSNYLGLAFGLTSETSTAVPISTQVKVLGGVK